ncbi:hypothetical protein ACFV2I_29240 [Streptomyces microflavus]|uniref:hypothetical protein n=1 Tax=Streptomyces microflavus TaxID=1919 RepID=UPI003660E696
MDATVVGLLAAVVGVGGTLGSAWLTHRSGAAARREEWQRIEQNRLAGLAVEQRQSGLQERKACYAAFNAAGRHYLATLSDHAHVLRHGAEDPRESLAEVDAARAEYGRQYAEAQMVVPDTVLAELRTVNAALGSVYGCLARLTRGAPREGDDIDAVRSEVRRAWQFLTRMRATMRADLDVTGPSHG